MTDDRDGPPILHGYFRSSASYRVRIALNIKNIGYNNLYYHLRKGEQRSPAYLSLNAQGLVPALSIADVTLTQSLAIIEYLDEVHPQPALLPDTSAGRARVRALAHAIACDIHPLNNLRVLQYLRTQLAQPELAVQTWYAHWVEEGFAALETMLRDSDDTGRFCHGDAVSIADICLVPQVANARNFNVDLTPYPTVSRIGDEASALPAFLAARPDKQADAE
jgi:maleylacetoacetate isomerase